MESGAIVWRATFGDEAPVPVSRASVTREDGTIFIDHYATEADAWQGLIANLESDAECAKNAEQQALAELAHQRRETEAVRERLINAHARFLVFQGVPVEEAAAV